MLSLRTCIELAHVIEKYDEAEVDRIFHVFDQRAFLGPPYNRSKGEKINVLLDLLNAPNIKGPFGNSLQMDALQYVVDNYYRWKEPPNELEPVDMIFEVVGVKYEDYFSHEFKRLANSLRMDGYVVKKQSIAKLLPEEIEVAQRENELISLLNTFGFLTSKKHLEEGTENHRISNWAAANSQFRSFVESMLMDIVKHLKPECLCNSGGNAIRILSSDIDPSFFKRELNEVKCERSFVDGFWNRLHPEGSHPGTSNEEDSTFRYHMVIVFAHYLLKRLQSRVQG